MTFSSGDIGTHPFQVANKEGLGPGEVRVFMISLSPGIWCAYYKGASPSPMANLKHAVVNGNGVKTVFYNGQDCILQYPGQELGASRISKLKIAMIIPTMMRVAMRNILRTEIKVMEKPRRLLMSNRYSETIYKPPKTPLGAGGHNRGRCVSPLQCRSPQG